MGLVKSELEHEFHIYKSMLTKHNWLQLRQEWVGAYALIKREHWLEERHTEHSWRFITGAIFDKNGKFLRRLTQS